MRQATSLKFGTSGLRGLAEDLQDGAAARYAQAFAMHMIEAGRASAGGTIFIGRDLRDSSPHIAAECWRGVAAAGLTPVDCDAVPTPALALYAMSRAAPAIMVTGSHIPADRNGLKFYRPDGEIDKDDEQAIAARAGELAGIDRDEMPTGIEDRSDAVRELYLTRYQGLMPPAALGGLRIGVYLHSSVACPLIAEVLEALGAEIVPLAASETFVPVDTEAVPAGTLADFARWVREHRIDAIVSTDADGDRPLIADETGAQVRGDAVGLISALHLGADRIVTPVTSNSGLERHGISVVRTRVGSPYVIAGMQAAEGKAIIGFEANGGLLTGSAFSVHEARLAPLPTRDALLPILCVLARLAQSGTSLGSLVAQLKLPTALSDRIENYAAERSAALLEWLGADQTHAVRFAEGLGVVGDTQSIDGVQIFLDDGAMLHVRPSGNAPEMRCYAEAPTPERAQALLSAGLSRLHAFTGA
jgi:phosphomannomutase